jgi:hypothetical protein
MAFETVVLKIKTDLYQYGHAHILSAHHEQVLFSSGMVADSARMLIEHLRIGTERPIRDRTDQSTADLPSRHSPHHHGQVFPMP